MSVRDEFVALAMDLGLGEPLTDDTELVASSRLDSLALFRLALWAEERTGVRLDPTAFDPSTEWATVGKFLAFVDTAQNGGAPKRRGAIEARVSLGGRDYRIVEYEPGMKQLVAAFQRGLWGGDQATNQRYLEWKYELNPFAAGSRIYLAFCGEELVGMRGFYGSLWEAGQPVERFPALVADDLLIHEAHRNTGLFNHLMQYALGDLGRNGHEFVLNLTANRINLAGSLSTGWLAVRQVQSIGRESRERKIRRRVRQMVARLPFLWRWSDSPWLYAHSERSPFARLDGCPASATAADAASVEMLRDAPIDEMAGFVAELPYDGRIRHVRTREYLDWRFANPLAEYRFVLARGREGNLDGYAVLHRHSVGGHLIAVSDLEARDAATVDVLLEHILRRGRAAGALAWRESLSPEAEAVFRRHGFSESDVAVPEGRAERKILVRFTADHPESSRLGTKLLDESGWDIRMLYSMRG